LQTPTPPNIQATGNNSVKKETFDPVMKVFQANQQNLANNKSTEPKKPSLAKALLNAKTLEEIENELLNNGSLKPMGNNSTTPVSAPIPSSLPAPPPGVTQIRNEKNSNIGLNETSTKNFIPKTSFQ
jgi:hypothetical protein